MNPVEGRRKRFRGFGYFKGIGPGVITGAADDDPSGIGTYSQIGASLRFDLLWTALISFPLAAAVVELAARLGLVTDKGLAAVVREEFPRTVVYPVLFLVVAANTFNVGADLGSMGAALHLLVPIPVIAGVVAFAVVTTVLEVRVPYQRYARLLRWLVLSLLAYFAVLFAVKVPWGEVLRHTLIPHLSGDREHIAALIAIFGTTISPYLFFWQAAEEVEEHEPPVTAPEIRRMRVDVMVGIAAGVAVMFAILTATAVTLGQHHMGNIETADQAAEALRPVAGRFASLLFTAGIVGTGLLAIPTLVGSSAYALAEAFHWQEGLSRSLRQAPGFYGVIIGGMVVGVALNLTGVNPIRALFLSAILNGLAAPPILVLMAIVGRGDALGRWRSGPVSVALVTASAVIMTALPAWYLLR
jgi:Mn2+/Fe2+ NRAMP family transporter